MFCSNCGKEIAAGAKFCANCGAAVNGQPTPVAESPKAPPPTAQREVPTVERIDTPNGNETENGGQPGKKKKGVPKKPLVIIAAVLVLFVGFGAVLSLFGDGSGPDSNSSSAPNLDRNIGGDFEGTATQVGTSSLDWIDNIPYVPGNTDLYYLEDEDVWAHTRSHSFVSDGIEAFIGLTDAEQVSYSTADINGGTVCFGQGAEHIVSYAEVWDETQGGVNDYYLIVSEAEPLIGKREDGYCFLFYKRDYYDGDKKSYCYEAYMVQPTDYPDYADWKLRAYIYCNDPQYFDYLNGKQTLEIISVPDLSGSNSNHPGTETISTSNISLSDWVSKIPIASNRGCPLGSTNIPTSVEASPYSELDEANMYGLADRADIQWYDLSGLIQGYRDGKRVVSARTWDVSMTISDPSWMLLYNMLPVDEELNVIEPVVMRTKEGLYLFCYRYEDHPEYKTSYIIFLAYPDDPSVPYIHWTITSTVAFIEKDDCDYLNGTIPVEVVHVPGMKITPEWINRIPMISGGVSVPELPENAQEITLSVSPQSTLWGMPRDSGVKYYNAVINGTDVYWAVYNGNVVYTSETILRGPVYVSNYSDLSSVQPLIITPKAEENSLPILNYYLLYKVSNCYLILWARNEQGYFDPYTHYREFRINGFIKVTDPEYCEILNGLQYLFVSRVPDSEAIQGYYKNT